MWRNSSACSVTPKKPWQPLPAQQLSALLATASLAHSCPEDLRLLPACTYFGTGKRNSQEERTLSEAGVGDLLDLLPGSASVCDPSVSALRERMRFSLRCACLIFTISMDVSAQVRCLKSCYCQCRVGESSQWSLEGDSVVQRQVHRAILHSLSYPIWLPNSTSKRARVSCKAHVMSAMMRGSHLPSEMALNVTATVSHLYFMVNRIDPETLLTVLLRSSVQLPEQHTECHLRCPGTVCLESIYHCRGTWVSQRPCVRCISPKWMSQKPYSISRGTRHLYMGTCILPTSP